jgi:hypothetical protein
MSSQIRSFFALLGGVTQGEPGFTPPGLACKVLCAFVHPATAEQPLKTLTAREQEVLALSVPG